ncbi:MAG TPA: response regulator [Phycisphaerae bacterium]|nr:response regulator [Phycisphaerae bacterium]
MDAQEKVSILLVDDRADKLLALEAVLADMPLEIVRATSGRDALRCLLQREFAVILLDVNMPGMDGFETAQLIRQRQSTIHTPIIFVTAYSDEVFMARGYSLGAVDYILQPVVPEILRSKVLVFVDLYRKNRQVMEQAAWQQQRASQLQKLASASVAINAASSMARTLQIITDSARDVIGAHQAITLFRIDSDAASSPSAGQPPRLASRAFSSFSDRYAEWRGRPLQLDPAAASAIATARTPTRLSASQLPHHPDYPLILKMEAEQEIPPVPGLLAAPLMGRDGRNMGVIYLADKIAGDFSADDEAILVQLSQMASVAIDNILSAEAREANRAKDQFIAVLSHELRTPLTPVLATVTSLQADKRLPADVHDDLRVIRRNVELEARLIDDLLDLTRISKGKIQLHMEVVNAGELLRQAVAICQPDIDAKSIELVWAAEARLPAVKGDATRLQQVFWNLVKNAVKFTPPRGRIEIRTWNPTEESFAAQISDNGIGIEAEVLPRIFTAFEQGRSTITRQFGGLGLGLAISKALVEQHKGSLAAVSNGRGRGAAFTVTLPATREQPIAPAFPAPRLVPSPHQRTIRVLLVEDHADTARVMTKLLQGCDYDVTWAASVAEALTSAAAARFDVLVSDIGLPDGSGHDLVRELRSRYPILSIALSGFGMEHDVKRSKDAGFEEHLTKPLNFQSLIDTIERLTASLHQPTESGALAV